MESRTVKIHPRRPPASKSPSAKSFVSRENHCKLLISLKWRGRGQGFELLQVHQNFGLDERSRTDRFACHEAVQHVRAQIDFVGPDDRPAFGVHRNLREIIYAFQRLEDAAPTENTAFKVQFPFCAIGERQFEAVRPKVPGLFDSWKHYLIFYSSGAIRQTD